MAHNVQEGKDFFGKPFHRGSWVVFQQKDYRFFAYGKVKDIAPMSLVILNEWTYSKGTVRETRQGWDQVIVVDEATVPAAVKELIEVTGRRI